MKNLDCSKALGPDLIPTIIYKRCYSSLSQSMTILFNLSLATGVIPNEWKTALVIPVFKKGDKASISNYRPISLLCIISKILERCIYNHIYPITKHDINTNQHGFMANRSTNTQLLDFYDRVFSYVDVRKQFDCVFLDFSKAFDSVPHQLLQNKLKSFGYNGTLLNWFKNYMANRRQKVVIQGEDSNYVPVLSGVPQGSILGPLLFLYYINDLSKCISDNNHQLYLYADDTKLGSCINNVEDCNELQKTLDMLCTWSITWGLKFNTEKCKYISFGNKNKIHHTYTMYGIGLEQVSSYTDLGITVCSNLKWDKHINNCVSRANQRIGFIKRCVGHGCSLDVKKKCYISMVRPLLEFNSIIWSGCTKNQLIKIESVQRKTTKYILNSYDGVLNYKERLTKCCILPLTLRRDYLDIVFFYNCIKDLTDFNIYNIVNHNLNNRNVTRSDADQMLLHRKLVHTESYRRFYSSRITYTWNKLPQALRYTELTDIGHNTTFKKELKKWLTGYFNTNFDVNSTCTWCTYCLCTHCK